MCHNAQRHLASHPWAAHLDGLWLSSRQVPVAPVRRACMREAKACFKRRVACVPEIRSMLSKQITKGAEKPFGPGIEG